MQHNHVQGNDVNMKYYSYDTIAEENTAIWIDMLRC